MLFPHYRQLDSMSCGPTCIRIVAKHFGKLIEQREVERLTRKGKQGVNLLEICDAAEALHMRALPAICTYETLVREGRFPFIAHWRQNHFVVVYGMKGGHVLVSDPAAPALLSYNESDFKRYWHSTSLDGGAAGVALFLEPTPRFMSADDEVADDRPSSLFLLDYLRGHGNLIAHLVLALLGANALTVLVPYLSELLVDEGIGGVDLQFAGLVVAAQILVLASIAVSELMRGWLVLHLAARVNLSLISDFLTKLVRLPARYFESRTIGDILQRVEDHKRIERFLSSNALDTVFALLTIFVYALLIATYSVAVFSAFAGGTCVYALWITVFLKRRKVLDYKLFNELARNRATEFDLIRGITEVKLTGAQKRRRWVWERIQLRLFKIRQRILRIEQLQTTGGLLLTQITLALATYLAARAVISGEMTLGGMVAVTLILGQVGVPLSRLVEVLKEGQDSLLSLERIREVHHADDEDSGASQSLPVGGDLEVRNVVFRYGDAEMAPALDQLTLTFKQGRTTAIVGSSGSGKSTLLKVLLRLYDPDAGQVLLNGIDLKKFSLHDWREQCGVVMQDGHIFPDTIARNIAVKDERIDQDRLMEAASASNALEFIERLPLGFHTIIGEDGIALSAGQRQRILIARALYRKPALLILDEATSALDTENERAITTKMAAATAGMTRIIVAHRLSTVRDADHIVVLDRGRIIEQGDHESLTARRGRYFDLIRNQLELGLV